MTQPASPVFSQLNLLVHDMAATIAFYRQLGLQISDPTDVMHAEAVMPGGFSIEWDTAESAQLWDSGSRTGTGGGVVIGFAVPTRDAVDGLYAELTAAGYHGHQRPFDVFWGARYAIVDDPDGNAVGLMSPVEDDRRHWPPQPAPAD